MTVYGFRHISRLRESNARVHRLSADVDTYERNKFYLKELEEEYSQLQSELAIVKERWNAEYVPAMEKRQALLHELDFAHNHTELYYARVADSLRGTDVNTLKAQLEELAQPELWDISTASAAYGETLVKDNEVHLRSSCSTAKSGKEPEQLCNDGQLAASRSSTGSRHYRSWNLSDTKKRVDELETVRAQIKCEMGAIGAQTCALTVKLRKMENEIASLRNAMSLPHEHLYLALRRELAEYRMEGIRRLLRVKVDKRQPESQQRLRSQATTTTSLSDAPSLAYSIGTTSTDISSIGMEFLKATQSSLCDIEAKFL